MISDEKHNSAPGGGDINEFTKSIKKRTVCSDDAVELLESNILSDVVRVNPLNGGFQKVEDVSIEDEINRQVIEIIVTIKNTFYEGGARKIVERATCRHLQITEDE
jgi:hypothetical protein